MPASFDGKVVFVAGAGATPDKGDGNGRSVVIAARAGCRCSRRLPSGRREETQALIENDGGACLALGADVTQQDQVKGAVARTLSASVGLTCCTTTSDLAAMATC